MKWVVHLLDLTDSKTGRPAHSKMIGLFSFLSLYALAWYEALRSPSGSLHWVKWTILWAAPFGVIGLRTWFANKTAQRLKRPGLPQREPNLWTDNEQGE